ncbi:MAG: hypothetical protein ACK5MW_07935 [Enterococcus sp.]
MKPIFEIDYTITFPKDSPPKEPQKTGTVKLSIVPRKGDHVEIPGTTDPTKMYKFLCESVTFHPVGHDLPDATVRLIDDTNLWVSPDR